MAKKRTPEKKKKHKVHPIDHIPKCSQQPRTPGGPKRRKDFSLFFCSSSSSLSNSNFRQGSLLESPSCKDISLNVNITSFGEKDKKNVLERPFLHCGLFQDERKGLCSNFPEDPEPWIARNCDKQRNKLVRTLGFAPVKSQVLETNYIGKAQGSVVWAKTAYQLWWPAEVLAEKSTEMDPSYQGNDGLVLIQYYGNNESAWVDPSRDLSQFEDCFEERSRNPTEAFQDALKQALNHKERLSLCRQLMASSDDVTCSNQQNQSPENWNSSSSSGTQSGCPEKGRGKRERKPKVHFEEMIFPLKSTRKVRRFRIMRFLGLAAPIGSPF